MILGLVAGYELLAAQSLAGAQAHAAAPQTMTGDFPNSWGVGAGKIDLGALDVDDQWLREHTAAW